MVWNSIPLALGGGACKKRRGELHQPGQLETGGVFTGDFSFLYGEKGGGFHKRGGGGEASALVAHEGGTIFEGEKVDRKIHRSPLTWKERVTSFDGKEREPLSTLAQKKKN